MTDQTAQTSQLAQVPPPQPGEIIPANRDLIDKCLRPGNASLAALEAIANAEAALEELSVNFKDWMATEVDRLSEAREMMKQDGSSVQAVERLFHVSHDLKGQAATLGYPLAAQICTSLCLLLDACASGEAVPVKLIDHHVDAVRAMVRESALGSQNQTASALSDQLRLATEGFIARTAQPGGPAAA